jgi:hypothetical protein
VEQRKMGKRECQKWRERRRDEERACGSRKMLH